MICELCGSKTGKIIYFGLPMRLCANRNCNFIDGFWSFIVSWFGWNGWCMSYDGHYLPALWAWLNLKDD